MKNHENPPGTMKNQPVTMKNKPKTMKNHETTLKNHGNQPKTLKLPWQTMETNQNHEKPCKYLENHGNQPKTMKNHVNATGPQPTSFDAKTLRHPGHKSALQVIHWMPDKLPQLGQVAFFMLRPPCEFIMGWAQTGFLWLPVCGWAFCLRLENRFILIFIKNKPRWR